MSGAHRIAKVATSVIGPWCDGHPHLPVGGRGKRAATRLRPWPSGLASSAPDTPVSTFNFLDLPEGSRSCLLRGGGSLAQRIHLFVDPEVSRSRKARSLPSDVHD